MGQNCEQTTGVMQQPRVALGLFETVHAHVGILLSRRSVVCGRGTAAAHVAPVRDAAEAVEFV